MGDMVDSLPGQTRHYDYGQLIEFIRPVHSDVWPLQQLPASETQSAITGDEARSFYEDLCSDGHSDKQETHDTSTSEIRNSKRKRDTQRHRKNTKRSRLEEGCLCDDKMTDNYDNLGQDFSKTGRPSNNMPSSEGSACLSGKHDSHNPTVKSSANHRIKDHRKWELFRLAQNGCTDDLKLLLQTGVDINCTDQFGWTATMSAAFEGHVSVVQTLVKSGADLTIKSLQRDTALSLAQKKGHKRVVEFIETFQRVGLKALRAQKKKKELVRFYCDVCKSEFTDTDQNAHNRSTVHIFNMDQKPKDDWFLIPSSNVGYRLMMKTGWDGSRGLGPRGKGQKFPVKTVLKQDRKGLGNVVKDKAKVTHFKANDKSAVMRMKSEGDNRVVSARTLSKRAQKAKQRRERQWEINIRHQLS